VLRLHRGAQTWFLDSICLLAPFFTQAYHPTPLFKDVLILPAELEKYDVKSKEQNAGKMGESLEK